VRDPLRQFTRLADLGWRIDPHAAPWIPVLIATAEARMTPCGLALAHNGSF
jgi:hypothetical protein